MYHILEALSRMEEVNNLSIPAFVGGHSMAERPPTRPACHGWPGRACCKTGPRTGDVVLFLLPKPQAHGRVTDDGIVLCVVPADPQVSQIFWIRRYVI